MKPILVQKYGGTSLGNTERLRSLISIVKNSILEHQVILVVSAISGVSKAEGSTNLLIKAVNNATKGISFEEELKNLKKQHILVTDEMIGNDDIINIKLDHELNSLRDFLLAINKIGEISNKSLDKIISIGERLSSIVISRILEVNEINAVSCDLSDVLDENEIKKNQYDEIDKLYLKCTEEFKNKIFNTLKESNSENIVPVVTGFFGRLPNGILEVIGRGYSDLTAALVAKSFSEYNVKELQIWKEVDGVFTADPRKVKNAKVLDFLSPVEAAELTFFGSEVIHPFTMEQVTSVGIPIRVLNTLKPDQSGTLIRDEKRIKNNKPTAITAKSGITVLSVTSNKMYDAKGFLMNLFSVLNEYDLVIDLVSTSEITVSCTVNDYSKLKLALKSLEQLGRVEIREKRAIIAVVGEGLQRQSFTASDMLKALSLAGIPVEMITQATTQMSISCVIQESLVSNALNVVHDSLFNTVG